MHPRDRLDAAILRKPAHVGGDVHRTRDHPARRIDFQHDDVRAFFDGLLRPALDAGEGHVVDHVVVQRDNGEIWRVGRGRLRGLLLVGVLLLDGIRRIGWRRGLLVGLAQCQAAQQPYHSNGGAQSPQPVGARRTKRDIMLFHCVYPCSLSSLPYHHPVHSQSPYQNCRSMPKPGQVERGSRIITAQCGCWCPWREYSSRALRVNSSG